MQCILSPFRAHIYQQGKSTEQILFYVVAVVIVVDKILDRGKIACNAL